MAQERLISVDVSRELDFDFENQSPHLSNKSRTDVKPKLRSLTICNYDELQTSLRSRVLKLKWIK